jgi:hypothetical protein
MNEFRSLVELTDAELDAVAGGAGFLGAAAGGDAQNFGGQVVGNAIGSSGGFGSIIRPAVQQAGGQAVGQAISTQYPNP